MATCPSAVGWNAPLDPLLASWYAVPFFVFYPLLVALFGLNALPLIAIGVIFAAPAMMLLTAFPVNARTVPDWLPLLEAPDVGTRRFAM